MTWQEHGRMHAAYLSSSVLVIEHPEDNPYLWVWAIWVRVGGKDVVLRTGTHRGTEEGAKQAVADALAVAAANLTNDAAAAAVVTKRAAAHAPEVGA